MGPQAQKIKLAVWEKWKKHEMSHLFIFLFFVPFHVVRKALFTKLHGPVHKVNGKSSTLCGSSYGSKPSRALFFEICDCVRQFGTCSEILKRMAWIWDGVCIFTRPSLKQLPPSEGRLIINSFYWNISGLISANLQFVKDNFTHGM